MIKLIKKSLNKATASIVARGCLAIVIRSDNTILTSFKSVSLSSSLSRGAILHFDGFNATTALFV